MAMCLGSPVRPRRFGLFLREQFPCLNKMQSRSQKTYNASTIRSFINDMLNMYQTEKQNVREIALKNHQGFFLMNSIPTLSQN